MKIRSSKLALNTLLIFTLTLIAFSNVFAQQSSSDKSNEINWFFLAVGLFLFPILYQPVHILRHHSHERPDHVCEHHHHPAGKAADLTQIAQKYSDCLICEYEFVIKDLPLPYVLVYAPIRHYQVTPVPVISWYQSLSFSQIHSRGPPLS